MEKTVERIFELKKCAQVFTMYPERYAIPFQKGERCLSVGSIVSQIQRVSDLPDINLAIKPF
jgi:hypothetical protein